MFQGKTANHMQYSRSSFVMPLIVEVYYVKVCCWKYAPTYIHPRDYEILGWCPAGPVLPHGEVPL